MHASALRNAIRTLNSGSWVVLGKHLTSGSKCVRILDNKCSNRLLQTSIQMESCKNVNYSELKELLDDPKNVVIDVREKQELDESGCIEGAHHVPLGEVKQALQLEPPEFEAKYGFPKPLPHTKIIFSCRSGKRSLTACELAKIQGYKNLWNYGGGFLDWSEKVQRK